MTSLTLVLAAALFAGYAMTFLLNRMLLRWPAGKTLFGNWGRCARCAGPLPWQALLPGLDLLWPGKLPACGHAMPVWRVFNLIALLAGSGWLAWLHAAQPLFALSQALLLLFVLLPLAAIDARVLEVEPRLVLGGIVLRLAALALVHPDQLAPMLGGMLMGAGLFAMVDFCYRALRRRPGLGEGDAAVMGLIGAFVGWQGILPVAALAALGGLAVGLPLLLAARRPLTTAIPFVPFLAAAGLIVYLGQSLWGDTWWGWIFMLRPALPG
ncbi:MAG: A24 family peptidase [SAR324 cluster bacterium]|nr:A24 family peptidase [SAR324 cluster bacterium]